MGWYELGAYTEQEETSMAERNGYILGLVDLLISFTITKSFPQASHFSFCLE